MSPEPHPLHEASDAPDAADHADAPDYDYWHALINEKEAGAFLDLTDRAMQAYRQRGDGCQFIRLSSRCIRYRRTDLKAWAEARMRSSTSDPGQAA